jgi:hypothetical protein
MKLNMGGTYNAFYGTEWSRDYARLQVLRVLPQRVIRDGNIVTSGTCPYAAAQTGLRDGTKELMSVFVGMLQQ